MKHNLYLYINATLFGLTFCSCQKVIDLNLSESASQIVIQGNIYDYPGPYTVKISKSVSFDSSSIYPAVTGAIAIISDNIGNADTLTETTAGIYVTSKIQGVYGRTYNLTVKTDEQTYLASSTMPQAVDINSIYTENSVMGNELQVTIDFADPANMDNYYRLIQYINNVQIDQFYVSNDKLYQGQLISYTFRSEDDESIPKIGDAVTIRLESIDKEVYEYFRTAGNEGGQSSSPANPTSNFNNGALGYFNASSVRTKSMVVK